MMYILRKNYLNHNQKNVDQLGTKMVQDNIMLEIHLHYLNLNKWLKKRKLILNKINKKLCNLFLFINNLEYSKIYQNYSQVHFI